MSIIINHIHLLGFVDIALNQNQFPSIGKFPASRYCYVSKSMLHQSNLFNKLIILHFIIIYRRNYMYSCTLYQDIIIITMLIILSQYACDVLNLLQICI